ncbi:replication protein [Staphylococcus equorum]|uniref:Replication protein n=1 Tax=Staphylococcus equorum TaxID=246432 RepID=A0AAP7LTN9_9STAP|nr:replication protein [Staphylococcus equorum]OEK55715.1 replication protein [Staphylococcus equorum]OEK56568.1 replication protein [Staphylococcus equorum]OEK63576.1 replication protein [Staphylococcus equorum]OEK64970.1 replication protein [Staphylococcus equorum]RYD12869.1 replication protein [Staphylococcus equorum]
MATFRVYKESGNFVMVHKDFIHDSNLSWKAKGILLYLLSRPDDWQIYETELEKHSSDGLSGIKSGIKELEEIGYIQRNRKRDENGRLNGYEYLVYEQPNHIRFSNVGKTVNGKTNNGKTVNGESHTTNNNRTNNNRTNNDLINNNKTNNDSNTSATDVTRERFENWWKLYDKKLDKKKAFSLFKSSLKKHSYEEIMNGTRDYLKTITNKQYQKYPKTFLGQESYMNDFTEEVKPTGQNQLERMKHDPSYWD